MLVIGRSYWVVSIQEEDEKTAKFADETIEYSVGTEAGAETEAATTEGEAKAATEGEAKAATETGVGETGIAGTKSIAYRGRDKSMRVWNGVMKFIQVTKENL